MRRTLVAAALALLLSGCGAGGPMSTPSEQPPPGASPSTSPGGSPGQGGTAVVPAARWQAILDDLGQRGVPTGSVEVVSAKDVTWNDGSLGCPRPGQFYTQALVPGMQVVVRAAGTEYDYRFGRGDRPKLCEK